MFASIRPPHHKCQVPMKLIPTEGSELFEIIFSTSQPDGFLIRFRRLFTLECTRRFVLTELTGLAAEGKFELKAEDVTVDLLCRPWRHLR